MEEIRFFFGRLIKIKESADRKKIYFMGIPVWRIIYCFCKTEYYLVGVICIFCKKSKWKSYNPCLVTKNFSPFEIDSEMLLSVLKKSGEFVFIPDLGNMGNMLLSCATLQFFDKNRLSYKMFDNSVADSVVFDGGGMWIKNYEREWLKFLPVFSAAKRVVILPSSFHDCQKLIDIFDERFVVFCRERKSYDYLMSQNTSAKIILDHDMAFRMSEDILHGSVKLYKCDSRIIGKISYKLRTVSRIARFMRQDSESAGNYETDMDLSLYAHMNMNIIYPRAYIDFCAKLMLCVVDSVDAVVTDRLHVEIASALMGKEVYLLDNSYGKISGVYENTMANNPRVYLCKHMPNIDEISCSRTATDNFNRLYDAMQ